MSVRFSVFVPVFNDARWLPGMIESLLAQTHPNWELVIGDNVSSEDVPGIVATHSDPRIRYHRWTTHVDFASNANRTLQLCSYEWLQYLSADDRLMPGCLARMAACVEEADAAGTPLAMVLTDCARYDERGVRAEHLYFGTRRIKQFASGIYDPDAWLTANAATGAPPWNIGSMALRATTVHEMGGYFREEIGLSPDLEVALRVAAHGPVGYVAEPLLHYTVRGDSITLGLSRRNLRASDEPPVAAALRSALAVHQHRREVPRTVRAAVRRQIVEQFVGRALQHRYLRGGRGRFGALRDLRRATAVSALWLRSPRLLGRAFLAVLAPRWLIVRLKERLMPQGGGA